MLERLVKDSRAIIQVSTISARGAIAIFGGVLLFLAAWFENDLAATVLGPTLIALCFILVMISFLSSRRNAQSLIITVTLKNGGDTDRREKAARITSQAPLIASIEMQNGVIPPTFALSITPILTRANDKSEQLANRLSAASSIIKSVAVHSMGTHVTSGSFPHRGNWQFTGASTTLSDALVLTENQKFIKSPDSPVFRVEPQQNLLSWEIVSSVERAGDTIQVSNERLGARLDLKTYHPADGMRSIAWKIFARRGELLARHPEAASTPEGTVLLFVAAPTSADTAAGAAVAYAKRCEEVGSMVIAGALGTTKVANNSDELLDLVIESAFDADPSRLSEDLAAFISSMTTRSAGGIIRRIAIVTPELVNGEYSASLKRCAAIAANSNIAVTLLIAPEENIKAMPSSISHVSKISGLFTEQIRDVHSPMLSYEPRKVANEAAQIGFEIGALR